MVQIEPQQRALACMEVLGSNRSTVQTVELPDLRAWVYSRPMWAEIGGDVHYLSVCGQAVLSRVVLADVSGHGNHVSNSAQLLHALMRAHINTWDQTEFVQGLNQSFRGRIARGKHATAVILGILRGTGETAFTSARHLPPPWYRSKTRNWHWLYEKSCEKKPDIEGLPVGLIPNTKYRQSLIQLEPDDIVVLYTDGITEAQDGFGDMLGRHRLMSWTRSAPIDTPEAMGQFLLSRLAEFRKENLIDDETIIAIQRVSQS
jgi:phosphoserine phosphatase RsbU/P